MIQVNALFKTPWSKTRVPLGRNSLHNFALWIYSTILITFSRSYRFPLKNWRGRHFMSIFFFFLFFLFVSSIKYGYGIVEIDTIARNIELTTAVNFGAVETQSSVVSWILAPRGYCTMTNIFISITFFSIHFFPEPTSPVPPPAPWGQIDPFESPGQVHELYLPPTAASELNATVEEVSVLPNDSTAINFQFNIRHNFTNTIFKNNHYNDN